MAISDLRTTFAAGTALNTGAAGTYLVGNVIDLTTTGRDIGAGEGVGDIFWRVAMTGTVTGGSAAFALATSDDPTFATGVTQVITTPVYTAAQLTAAAAGLTDLFASRLPPFAYKRYLGLLQITSVSAITAGTVTSDFVEDARAIRFYPQAFS